MLAVAIISTAGAIAQLAIFCATDRFGARYNPRTSIHDRED